MSIARYQQGIARNASESAHPSLWKGLKGFWSPSSDNGGARIQDRANYKSIASYVGAPKRISRGSRKPIYFDGAADGASSAIDLSTSGTIFSFAFWVYIRSYGSADILLEYTANWNSANGFLCYLDSGPSALWAGSHSNAFSYNHGYVSAPSTGKWSHVAVVLNRNVSGSGGNAIFIDGTARSITQISSNTLGDALDNSTLYMGCRGGSSLFASVEMDDIGLWNRALSTTEIKQLANGASPLERIDEVPQYTVVSAPAGGQPIWKRLGGVAFARQTGNITTW